MMNFEIIKHPLLEHKLALIRDKNLGTKDFKIIINEISSLMVYEITRNLSLQEIKIETPITSTIGKVLTDKIVLIPILRAGLGMVDGIHNLIPTAKIAHIGMYRDPSTLKPHVYYAKYPECISDCKVFILDPLLATGGSVLAAIDNLISLNVKDITVVSIIGVKEGLNNIYKAYPNVKIYLAALDEGLNEKAYIYPGLGDAGDRLFGTK